MRTERRLLVAVALVGLGLAGSGCHRDMRDQPRVKPYRASDFFGDRRSARPVVEGTVARGQLRADTLLYTGKINGRPADLFPFEITAEVLARGRERYDIYCSPCHDFSGSGRGMIIQRGHKQPVSFHSPRLRQAPVGYFFDVITNGFATMYDYSYQLRPEDRWAVIAWIRTLQTSQRAGLADVPAGERSALETPARPRSAAADRRSEGGH